MNYLLCDDRDLYVIPVQRSVPNFVTLQRILAPAIHLKCGDGDLHDLSGKIVCIEHADPGFDWIFAHKIAGLVTKYGGSNSHMTIRCREFSLPAAIGCGEAIYSRLEGSQAIELDSQNQTIVPTFLH